MAARSMYGGVREDEEADDFVISDHAVGITMRGSGLKIDVAPVLNTDEPDDRGYLSRAPRRPRPHFNDYASRFYEVAS